MAMIVEMVAIIEFNLLIPNLDIYAFARITVKVLKLYFCAYIILIFFHYKVENDFVCADVNKCQWKTLPKTK